MITASKMYKVVCAKTHTILFEGSKKAMTQIVTKTNKQAPNSVYLGNSPGKTVGDKFK